MAEQDNLTIARTFFEAWNERDFARGTRLAADDAEIVEVATGERFRGPQGLRQEYEKWANGLPDGRVEIRNAFAAGDWALVEATVRGTNTGPFASPAGEIPPTNRRVELDFCSVSEIKNGKLVGTRHYHDAATLMRQLGLIPEAVGTTA